MLGSIFLAFAFYYPLMMAWFWMLGAINYYLRRERTSPTRTHPPELPDWPKVTLVVPCHNEGDNARDTLAYLADQDYPDFEIIAINDGSRDNTAAVLDELTTVYPQLRVLHFPKNQGKAMGLRMAALAANSEFLVCIDGDALLDRYATRWMMWHLVTGPRVGAVTGNPRIRNRSSLLGRLQVGEFASIIGLIKRAQRTAGRIFTVSGVIAGFRRSALHQIGYWSTDMVTEDIDVSWRLQLDHWDIRYEPNALCWILMPETLKGLWKQRLRWAQGGAEVARRYSKNLLIWRKRRMWPVLAEYIMSVIWSYTILIVLVVGLIGLIVPLPTWMRMPGPLPTWYGAMLATTCIGQFLISMVIDRRYEERLGRQFFWIIWYPLAYWLLGMLTTVVAVPTALSKKKGTRAVWESPDRGIR
ncbi:MAG: poly-beta-1,6-N-acetyl-D-glucosamine synthase [Terracidiphilus sp.]|jgi:poly-beta-1,6-N-acetyl-D-glucosamine synthase